MNIRYPIYEGVYRILTMEFMEKDSLRMEFIQSIVRNGERKSQESNGTAYETVQAPVLKGQEAVE